MEKPMEKRTEKPRRNSFRILFCESPHCTLELLKRRKEDISDQMFPQPRVSVSSWSCWFPGRLCRSENREILEEEEERQSLKMSSLLTESFRLPRDSPLTQTATECTGFYRTIILTAWDSWARLFSGEIVNSPSEMKKKPKQETKCGHNCELKTL